jgi:hypothetical protein
MTTNLIFGNSFGNRMQARCGRDGAADAS